MGEREERMLAANVGTSIGARRVWTPRLAVGSLYRALRVGLLSCLAAVGCGGNLAANSYFKQFGCEADSVNQAAERRFVVHGCAGWVEYYCARGTCIEGDAELPESDTIVRTSADGKVKEATEAQNADGTGEDQANREESASIAAVIPLEGGFGLRLQAQTSASARRVRGGLFGTTTRIAPLKDCRLDWMINGQRMKSPVSKFESDGRVSALRADLPPRFVEELGAAQQISLRACRKRFHVDTEGVFEVRTFVANFESDLAWDTTPSESSAGMLAPVGGWPPWNPLSGMPSTVGGNELRAKQLFDLLAPSVFRVEAILVDGTAQGSAVAVGPTELLTNCHVVAGARKITLRQKEDEWVGKIRSADAKRDRCILSVQGIKLKPVKGARRYDSLEVGEPLYTLGTPAGLDLSISDGILSGLRELDDIPFIQTTAAISPGSSGGGLFDAHGNLVGITTLVLAGRERLNQSLNFAVPADAFYRD